MKSVILTALTALAAFVAAAPASDGGIPNNLTPAGISNPADSVDPISLPSGESGHLISDLAPDVHTTLIIVGQDSQKLLVQLYPSVVGLLTGLGLPQLGVPVGQIVKKAGNVGELLKDLGGPVENLLTVISRDGSVLLIQLSPEISGLLAGILPSLAVPVGEVVYTIGQSVKRDQIPDNETGRLVQDLAPDVKNILAVVGPDTKQLLIKLSPEVAGLLGGLGLAGLGGTVGTVVYKASSLGDLVKNLGPSVQGLLAVVGTDGSALLIQLSPTVAGLVAGLGLTTIATPVGQLLYVVGLNL